MPTDAERRQIHERVIAFSQQLYEEIPDSGGDIFVALLAVASKLCLDNGIDRASFLRTAGTTFDSISAGTLPQRPN